MNTTETTNLDLIKLQNERRHYSDMAKRDYASGLFDLAIDAQECAQIVHREIARHLGLGGKARP